MKRVNRFVVKIEINGKYYLASNNNTGRLEEFMVDGKKAFCIKRTIPKKTTHRLFAILENGKGAIIDTNLQMKSFEIALEKNLIPWLKNCKMIKRNPRLGNSTLDYLISCNGDEIFLELKSAVLRIDHEARYPDCPTTRGQRHIKEIIKHVRSGNKAMIIFIAALPNVNAFRPHEKGDPLIKKFLEDASRHGVPIKAINIAYDPLNKHVFLIDADLPVLF